MTAKRYKINYTYSSRDGMRGMNWEFILEKWLRNNQ